MSYPVRNPLSKTYDFFLKKKTWIFLEALILAFLPSTLLVELAEAKQNKIGFTFFLFFL
ncbi:hypothetical protein PJO47_29570 [Mycobacterium kansasii]